MVGTELKFKTVSGLRESAKTFPQEAQYLYLNYKLQAVRSGPRKLALCPQVYSMGIKTGGAEKPGLRLYNLDTDIAERTNVAAQYPEVVKHLKKLADHQAATLCDNLQGPGIRPPGQVEDPQPLYPMKPGTEKRPEHKPAHEAE